MPFENANNLQIISFCEVKEASTGFPCCQILQTLIWETTFSLKLRHDGEIVVQNLSHTRSDMRRKLSKTDNF